MRGKRKIALLLAAIMLLGTGSLLKPTEVQAAGESNTFTLTTPTDTVVTKSGWNQIGDIKVTGSIEDDRKVTVKISTANGSILKHGDNQIPYTIKMAESDTTATSAITFSSSQVNTTGGATQPIGATADFSGKPDGTYTDTITCTATLTGSHITMTNAGGNTITTANLGTPKEFTWNSKTYYAYNDFIRTTTQTNWEDAQNFVAALNAAEYDGHNDWALLSDKNIAHAWWVTTGTSAKIGASSFGGVSAVWSSQDYNTENTYLWRCNLAYDAMASGMVPDAVKANAWKYSKKNNDSGNFGILVIRGAN